MKELSLDDGLAQFQMTDDLIAQYNNGQGATAVSYTPLSGVDDPRCGSGYSAGSASYGTA